jgi:hypothetical protein
MFLWADRAARGDHSRRRRFRSDVPVIVSITMRDSDYWIVSCGEELIGGHNDVWSITAMEMYAGIFRAVEKRRQGSH